MSTTLFVNASLGGDASHSQALAREFLATRPGDRVITRDLAAEPPPLIDAPFAGALYKAPADYTPAEAAIMAVSDRYVDEVLAADTIVIAAPVYNFTLPTALKAWLDLVYRFGKTLEATPEGTRGLLGGKRVLILSARLGDYGPGTGREAWDHHEPYLRFILGRMGIADVRYVAASQNPRMHDAETLATQMAGYKAQVHAAAAAWAEAPALSAPGA